MKGVGLGLDVHPNKHEDKSGKGVCQVVGDKEGKSKAGRVD